jgi:hypothetical protein
MAPFWVIQELGGLQAHLESPFSPHQPGTGDFTVADEPTVLPSYQFIVRQTEEDRRLMNLGLREESVLLHPSPDRAPRSDSWARWYETGEHSGETMTDFSEIPVAPSGSPSSLHSECRP